MIDEEELIRRFKDGASDAFDAIYASYYKPVYNYTYRLTKDKTLAEDLTQDSLIKVFANLKDADESRTLLPWIFRIAHNTCIDYYRKNRASFELMEDIACHDSETNCPEYIYLNREKYCEIKKVLLMINQKYRTALLLRVFQNLSYREIASRLKLNEAAVKTLIHRGRQQFQKIYAEAY